MCDCCGGHGHDPKKPVLIKPVSIKLVQPEDKTDKED